VNDLRARLPELPDEKSARLINVLGLSAYDTGVIIVEREVAAYYDRAVEAGKTLAVDAKPSLIG